MRAFRTLRGMASAAIGCAVLSLAPAQGQAQDFPTRSIKMVVPYAAGGGVDLVARMLAEGMSKDLKQPVIIDNRPGAGTVIGTTAVAKSPPDGYTLVMASAGYAINASYLPKLPYNTQKDFAAVAYVGYAPQVLLVQPSSSIKTYADLIALMKQKNGALTYGTPGNGTAGHLAGELLSKMTGLKMTAVPYKGGAPSVVDLLGGQLDMVITTAPVASKFIETGQLRALAVTSSRRAPAWPSVPTIAENGVPGYESNAWYGVLAPAGTSPEIIARLNRSINAAIATAQFKAGVTAEGVEPVGGSPQSFQEFIGVEIEKWAKVVKAGNLVAN